MILPKNENHRKYQTTFIQVFNLCISEERRKLKHILSMSEERRLKPDLLWPESRIKVLQKVPEDEGNLTKRTCIALDWINTTSTLGG